MTLQETNWLNLFGKYAQNKTTWHALTTVYSPELEIIRSYRFTRSFSTNADKSIVYHQNIYYLPNEQIKKQSWELEQQQCDRSDGIIHPEAEHMRAIGLENGTSIWLSKQFGLDEKFGMEVFFQQQDWRYSVIPMYQGENLARIVTIKENTQHFPSQINPEKIDNLSGKWHLKRIQITPDLQKSTEELSSQEIELHSSVETNQSYFLPERIMLNLPKVIEAGREFFIVVGKQITDNTYKQVKTQYEPNGQFMGLISDTYNLE